MTDTVKRPEKVPFAQRPVGKLGCVLVLLLVAAFISILLGVDFWLDIGFRLICGWIIFAWENIQGVTANWEIIGCGVGALAIGTFGLHRLFVWGRKGKPWKWAWTISITALTLMLFASSISMTGIIHQFGWMMREPLTKNYRRALLTQNVQSAKQMFCLLVEYDDDHGQLPEALYLLDNDGYTKSLYDLEFRPQDKGPSEPWVYLTGGEPLFSSDESSKQKAKILLLSPRPIKGKWIALFSDGTVKQLTTQKIHEEHPQVLEKAPNLLPR